MAICLFGTLHDAIFFFRIRDRHVMLDSCDVMKMCKHLIDKLGAMSVTISRGAVKRQVCRHKASAATIADTSFVYRTDSVDGDTLHRSEGR